MHWKPSTGNGNPEDRQQGMTELYQKRYEEA